MLELQTYEGLIRNHKELSAELGVATAGMPRLEREKALVLAAYEKWGVDMGKHINGQFALSLYNPKTQQLFATRDILGAELLFYYPTDNGELLVSSQISDLFTQSGFARQLNPEMVQFFLAFNYVPGEDTLFKGVKKLEPGGYLIFDAKGLQLGRYWELSFEPDESKNLDTWADEIETAMEASLRDICDENERYDTFLSGGVDSSYILAKSKAQTGFCAAYKNQQISEAEDACATAAHLARGFEAIEVTPEEFFANVDEFLLAYEQPSADVAGLSLYSACKHVHERTKLIFSGEGADEFFAGYSTYQNAKRYAYPGALYYGSTYIMAPSEQRRFLKNYCENASTRSFMQQRAAGGEKYDTLNSMLYNEMRTYFEGSILFNSTRIAHGTGLDIRMPFCDLRMFNIARRMPARYKAADGKNKIALRAAAARVLPEQVAYRKKLGFPVPVRSWLANPAYNADVLRAFESPAAAQFFNMDETGALLDAFLGKTPRKAHPIWFGRRKGNLWRYVWTIYIFIRWYELFFEDNQG